MSNHNSPEYKAIIQCSPDLTTAVKDDLTLLSEELLAAGLIAENNVAGLQNQFIGRDERAVQLVGYVRNRVSLNTDNYHSFVGVLEKRKDIHKDILKTLDKKFRELGGRYPPSKPSESYKDGPASGSKRGGAGDLSQSLKRSTESDVFQRFYAEMNSSITDPDQFAAELIQHKFTTKQTADNKMPSGIPNYRKVGNLLGIVDSHIRSVSSVTPERVKERFIILLLILRNKLGLDGLAQKMETECYGTQQEHAIANEAQNDSNGATADHQNSPSANSSNGTVQRMTFSESLSSEEFKSYLKSEGVLPKDYDWLIDNGINAQAFPQLSDSYIDSEQFVITIGGKLILKKLLRELKDKCT